MPFPRWCPVDACSRSLIFLWSLIAIVTLQLVAALAFSTLKTMRAGRKHCRFLCAASSITPYALLLLQQSLFAFLYVLFHGWYHFFEVFVTLARWSTSIVGFYSSSSSASNSYIGAPLLLMNIQLSHRELHLRLLADTRLSSICLWWSRFAAAKELGILHKSLNVILAGKFLRLLLLLLEFELIILSQ